MIPGFPGDRGPAVHHVFPTAVAGGGDQVEGLGGRAVVEKPFQKILGDINRAAHAARGNPGRDLRLVFWGDQAKGEGEEAGVLGGVVSTFTVAETDLGRVEEHGLEREPGAGGLGGFE
mgnify:CR=1 FL=1